MGAMRNLSKRLLRIVMATLLSLAIVWVALFWCIRRPSLGGLEVEGLDIATLPVASAGELRQHVTFLAGTLARRDVDAPNELDRAALYIETAFLDAGGRVELQEYSDRSTTYRNIVVRFGPPEGPVVVAGAHYDSFGLFGPNPGADDNASGVAGLLELARLFGIHPPRQPVELVAYATEEPPHFAAPTMGSAVHARRLVADAVPVAFALNLEMIGYFVARQPWPNLLFRSLYPGEGDFIAVVGRYEEVPLVDHVKRAFRTRRSMRAFGFIAPAWLPGTDSSDHRSYWSVGIPAVMVTDSGFIRNPNYHTPRDTPETLDYERMAQVVDGVYLSLLKAGRLDV